MRAVLKTVVAFAAPLILAAPVLAQAPVERGEQIASQLCSRCHAIGRKGESPMGVAPPFRTLSKRYPLETLAEAFAEGIVTGHPAMPRFTFAPVEIDALLAFLESVNGD